jgi:protein-S-isoprenylcysteine O-methyltransferase Ste14
MMGEQSMQFNPVVIWLRFVIRMTLFAVALMWPAGIWNWLEAWVLLALWTAFGLVMLPYLLHHDPGLLVERMKLVPLHKDQKTWDKVIMALFFVAAIGLYVVPGFDVMRYEWSEPLPVWTRVFAIVLHLPCFVMLAWVMRENTFLAQVVKIDKKRGHQAITTGPYAIVRHPMYTVVIILLFAIPVALGSRYALMLAVFLTALLVVRTYLEDRTLLAELEGYLEYTEQTRYRLVPGIW